LVSQDRQLFFVTPCIPSYKASVAEKSDLDLDSDWMRIQLGRSRPRQAKMTFNKRKSKGLDASSVAWESDDEMYL
jgi:hypothetical protein